MKVKKLSNLFYRTYKEVPKEAEDLLISEQLLRKAGIMYKPYAGGFYLNNFGQRVLDKISAIIKDELEKIGCEKVYLPLLTQSSLWQESGRLAAYQQEEIIYEVENRKGQNFCLAPTHEEAMVDFFRRVSSGLKHLPTLLYHETRKFRDEIRPRHGLIRGTEFIMNDAYSFAKDAKGLAAAYAKFRQAYLNIFTRLGLDFKIVTADSGSMGGKKSEEFMALTKEGSETLVCCEKCGYAANEEAAIGVIQDKEYDNNAELTLLHTPDIKSVEELMNFTGLAAHEMIKTIIYAYQTENNDEQFAAFMIRGDRELNENKIKNFLKTRSLRMANDEEIKELTGAITGFAGPFNMAEKIRLYGDNSIKSVSGFLCGLNRTDYHNINVQFGRDLELPECADFAVIKTGDYCQYCQEQRHNVELKTEKGFELGHIFQLGIFYSEEMGVYYQDRDGKSKPVYMGSYGIGVTRLLALLAEQNHDENGIIWPEQIAPYKYVVIQAGKSAELTEKAEAIARKIVDLTGEEVLLDERQESPGFKFKDAELLGYPYQIVAGKLLNEDEIEIRSRNNLQNKKRVLLEEFYKQWESFLKR